MNPGKLDRAFRAFLQTRELDVLTAEAATGVRAMLDFYAKERADGCDVTDDADMLLLQWGTFDWGLGEHVELDITRQVMLPDECDDDAIWQLHLTYRFCRRPCRPPDEHRPPGARPARRAGARRGVRSSAAASPRTDGRPS